MGALISVVTLWKICSCSGSLSPAPAAALVPARSALDLAVASAPAFALAPTLACLLLNPRNSKQVKRCVISCEFTESVSLMRGVFNNLWK